MIQYLNEAMTPGAKVCVIHFRSRTKQAEGFEKYPTPPNVSNIYVNNGSSGWYLHGVPGLGGLEDSARALKEKAQSGGASRIVCIGASMGAFGAGLFASIMGAELICFGPELWPNVYTGFSRRDLSPETVVDIASFGRPSRALLVAGVSCPSDLICALHFHRQWANSTALFLKDCGHESARNLKDKELLAPLIADFCFERDLSPYQAHCIAPEVVALCTATPPAALDAAAMAAFVGPLVDHLPLNDRLRLAHRLVGEKSFPAALPLLTRMKAEHGEIPEMLLLEATVLRKLKRPAASIDAAKRIENDPRLRHDSLWLQAMALEQLGRLDEALATYRTVHQEGRRSPLGKAAAVRVKVLTEAPPA